MSKRSSKFLGADCLGRPRFLGGETFGGGLAARPLAISRSYSDFVMGQAV